MYYHDFYDVESFIPKSIRFDVWSANEIKKLSVAKIHSFIPFDGLGYPVPGGLYDSRLGPLRFDSDPCATCGHSLKRCAGHFGHIELPFPVVNPLFMSTVTSVLKSSCLECHKIMISDAEKCVYVAQLKLIDAGYLIEAHELDTYLEENMYKMVSQIQDDMAKFCRDTITSPSVNLCKFADEKWRYYAKKLLRQGAVAKKCLHCDRAKVYVKSTRDRLFIQGKENTYLMPINIRDHLRAIWENDGALLGTLFKMFGRSKDQYPTDICLTDCVLVTPPNTRPINVVNQKRLDHPKSAMYRHVLLDCQQIRSILQVMNKDESISEDVRKEIESVVDACRGETINDKLHNAWDSLQVSVNALLDANAMKMLINTSVGVPKIGLRQLIEKKSGILRKNMMGKRVDFFARSVVTPDPMLNINEIGVPEAFAKKLTFPVPVTPWNVTQLRKAVINGPQKYPGANIVEDDRAVVGISGSSEDGRKSLANTLLTPKLDSSSQKVVHRHLQDGDILLINRQPSLHKPSIMAHKARVLRGEKTFRLHYGNCKAYNADFDGDELNAHFPQGELARAEASEIVNAAYQYLVPRDGTPLSGLIQDHVIAGFRLSLRDKLFDRRDYNQFVFQAIGFMVDDIQTLPPAILKPKKLWTGKQVISTIIINLTPKKEVPLNLDSKTKLGYGAWPSTGKKCDYMTTEERIFMSETNVIIRQGELLCGVLDKNHIGSTQFSLVHYFYELYGGECSANLLSAFSKLFTYYQQKEGFTLGVQDILVRERANRKRDKLAAKTQIAGVEAAKRALDISATSEVDDETLDKSLEIAYKKNSNFRGLIDREYKSVLDQFTNDINKVCLPIGLLQPFPYNNLQLMVLSGAKGSSVNTMQISCLLGQIELEGKRPPLMISGKSLPSFRPYDPSPMAGGFIASRFMTGLRPQEFFFHCMAGREGLIDTAVKTSRSGYLQRCLVKHLEGLVVNYDMTVRDLADNSVIQFMYGEDGLDILKSQLLKPDQMKFFRENMRAFDNKREVKKLQREVDNEDLETRKQHIARLSAWKKKLDGPFLKFCRKMANNKPQVTAPKKMLGRTQEAADLCHLWYTVIDDDAKKRYARHVKKTVNPVVADFKPDTNFGAVSEVVENMIDEFIAKNGETLSLNGPKNAVQKFKNAVYLKTFKSLCQPGEAVGVLAAQSVGEPSTQMTLNTFHFAGRGEMNVTLGIPRLREIIMVASKRIKTPTTEIPFKTDVPDLEQKAEFLRKSLTRVVLKDVLEKVKVKESLRLKGQQGRMYELNLHYLPRRGYSSFTNLKPRQILRYVEKEFLAKLYTMLKKNTKSTYSDDLVLNEPTAKRRKHVQKDDDEEGKNEENRISESDDDSDVGGDGDASEAKRKNRQSDAMDYDDDEEEEEVADSPSTTLKTSKSANNDNQSDDVNELTIVVDSELSNSESNDEDENTIDLKKIRESCSGSSSQKKGAHVAEDYGIESVTHDAEKKMWSKIVIWVSFSKKRIDLSDLLPTLVGNAVVYEKPGIKRAITYTNSEGLLTLKTEGSQGVKEFFKYDSLLDLNKIYSNDIHAMARTYGIEAANRVIVKEVQEVFKVYGITVDPRHLLLIADYMTFDGTYQPLNRAGMDNCPSPLQQMTFESTLKYLKNATIRNLEDNLRSPSSSLIVGQESKIGSGLSTVLTSAV